MTTQQFVDIAKLGESVTVEYKTCISSISHSLYETVCSFLNHSGGWILMGVHDDGEMIGVDEAKASDLMKDIINTINNPENFLPCPFFQPEKVQIEGKTYIGMYVPSGQYVYRLNGRYWDRNGDADIDVTDSPELLLALFERKNPHLFEEREVLEMSMDDIDADSMKMCRRVISVQHSNHPWLTLDDKEMLLAAHLAMVDGTGVLRFKYAALLLFGTADALERLIPRYRIEAIFRMCTYQQYEQMEDVANRYDDRLTIRENLVRVYDKLMEFAERHLPDKFYLPEGSDQRKDIRHQLMREIIGNLCVHPDYHSGYASFLEIYKDRIITRNASRLIPHIPEGDISISQLGNYTKNPLLVKVFREMDWVEDLGSGTRNILKYAPLYYPDYKIGIDNGQQFIFALTYASAPEMTVKNDGRSLQNDGEEHKMTVKNDGKLGKRDQKKKSRQNAIIGLIKKNPTISEKQMAQLLNVGTKTIERDIKVLSANGVVFYDGKWNILK